MNAYLQEEQPEIYGHLALAKLSQILCYDCMVGNAAIRIFGILAGHADQEGVCFPSIKKIAYALGISRTAVSKQIDNLILRGYLVKASRFSKKTGGRKTNMYKFNYALAQNNFREPDIFSKRHVTLIVTYYATILHFKGEIQKEVSDHATLEGDIKKKDKIKNTQNKKEKNTITKKSKNRAQAWDIVQERKELFGISKAQELHFKRLNRELKHHKEMHEFSVFTATTERKLKIIPEKEKFPMLISEYEKELEKYKSK